MREVIVQALTLLPMWAATVLGLLFIVPLIAHLIVRFEFKSPRTMGLVLTVFTLFSLYCSAATLYQGLGFACVPNSAS